MFRVDPAQLPPAQAAEVRRELEAIPATAWGASFFAPHPKPWDFLHVLQMEDDNGMRKRISFHQGQGPPELSRLAETLRKLASEG